MLIRFEGRVKNVACGLLLTGFMVGCGGSDDSNSGSTTRTSVTASGTSSKTDSEPGDGGKSDDADETATGTLVGTISFAGAVPDPRLIQATKNPEVCKAGEGEVQDVHVKDGKLADAVVEVSIRSKNLPPFTAPEDGFVIRQKNCRFEPRMTLAYDGAELTIHNDDPVQHNVNTGQWNVMQSPGGDPLIDKIRYKGTSFVRLTCNVHGWMETWVYVARSPYYSASDESGSFRIEGVPVGEHSVIVSHPSLGKQRFKVKIEADGETTQDVEFEGS